MGKTYDLTNPDGDMCKACQWCCRHLILPVEGIDTKFLNTRGHDCIRRQWSDEVLIDVPCQHITDSGCAIYKDRPLACILYPWESHPLVKEHCELMRRNYPN